MATTRVVRILLPDTTRLIHWQDTLLLNRSNPQLGTVDYHRGCDNLATTSTSDEWWHSPSKQMSISNNPELLPVASALDDKIFKLQLSLAIIKKQKTLLDKVINEHRTLLTPFRQLPDDVLGEIFIWCLPDEQNAIMTAREPPLLLGRVCSRWRWLAYNSPRLWTTLHISSPIPPPKYPWDSSSSWVPPETRRQLETDFDRLYANHCDAVQDWLNRSRLLPLCISIDLDTNEVRVPALLHHKLTASYFNILRSSSSRWRSLELAIPSWTYGLFLGSIQPDSLTSLEFLQITFPARFIRSSSHLSYWKSCGLLRSKNLRVLHLARNPFRLTDLGIAWTQITHLILGSMDGLSSSRYTEALRLQQAYAIFQDCPRLQHCSLEVIEDTHVEFNPFDTVFLPSLSSLALMDGAFSLEVLLRCIQIPALCDVSYYTRFLPSTKRRSPLLTLLRQSDNNIRSLTTSLDFFTVNDLVECFSLVPNLANLRNWYHWPPGRASAQQKRWHRAEKPFQRKVMKAILGLLLPNSFNSDNAYPCPHLQSLILTESFGLTDRDALKFLQQRLEANVSAPAEVEQLAEVDIHFDNPMSVDIRAHLQSYIDEGMKVKVVYAPSQKVNRSGAFNPVNGLVVGNQIYMHV